MNEKYVSKENEKMFENRKHEYARRWWRWNRANDERKRETNERPWANGNSYLQMLLLANWWNCAKDCWRIPIVRNCICRGLVIASRHQNMNASNSLKITSFEMKVFFSHLLWFHSFQNANIFSMELNELEREKNVYIWIMADAHGRIALLFPSHLVSISEMTFSLCFSKNSKKWKRKTNSFIEWVQVLVFNLFRIPRITFYRWNSDSLFPILIKINIASMQFRGTRNHPIEWRTKIRCDRIMQCTFLSKLIGQLNYIISGTNQMHILVSGRFASTSTKSNKSNKFLFPANRQNVRLREMEVEIENFGREWEQRATRLERTHDTNSVAKKHVKWVTANEANLIRFERTDCKRLFHVHLFGFGSMWMRNTWPDIRNQVQERMNLNWLKNAFKH